MDPPARAPVAADSPAVVRAGERRASAPQRWRRCLSEDLRAADAGAAQAFAGLAAFRAHGQARDLPVSIGRAVADGHVRLQAAAERSARHRSACLDTNGAAFDRHDLDASDLSGGAAEVQVRAARTVGAWVSELLPHTAKVVDELCFIKSMHTEAINHDPGITFFQTGAQLAGRPSIGSWISYGLGKRNNDLPAFVVMVSQGTGRPGDQPLYDRLWGSGFLPSKYQGVKFRSIGDPVLYLSNPSGIQQRITAAVPRSSGQAEPDEARGVGRSGDLHAHRAVRNGVPDAELGARADGSLQRSPSASSSFTVRIPASPARLRPTACWRGALPNAACASSSCFIAAGITTTTCRNLIVGQCLDTDQPVRCADPGSERARPAGGYVGRLGRRVRTNRLLPGQAHGRRLRARSSSALLHGLARRRRHEAGYHLRGDRRLLLQHHAGPGARARSARDDPALPGNRPYAADFQISGPPLPADGRPWSRETRASHVTGAHAAGSETLTVVPFPGVL